MRKENLKAMIPATSDDSLRSYHNISYNRDGDKITMLSTNGHIAVRVRSESRVQDLSIASALVPKEMAKQAIKSCSKFPAPTLDIELIKENGENIVKVQNSISIPIPETSETYPDINRVIPRDNKFVFALCYHELRRLLDSLKPLVGKDGTSYNGIEFFADNPSKGKGIGFCFKGQNDEIVDGVIMPVRTDRSSEDTFGNVWDKKDGE